VILCTKAERLCPLLRFELYWYWSYCSTAQRGRRNGAEAAVVPTHTLHPVWRRPFRTGSCFVTSLAFLSFDLGLSNPKFHFGPKNLSGAEAKRSFRFQHKLLASNLHHPE
jgi:hypothetical protein